MNKAENRKYQKRLGPKRGHGLIALMLAFGVWLTGGAGPAAAEIDPHLAIRAIIGEAANQGERGMLAVACAIRNRGTLKGVFGVNASHVDRQPQWVWRTAKSAWERSAKEDIVRGADHWENVRKFGRPFWASEMVVIDTIGDHVFFKKKK